MSDSARPQKGARKLTIDGEEWWWKHSHFQIPIWNPEGKKTMHSVLRARHEGGAAVTPFDVRVHIDRHIRKRPESEVQALIQARKDRIEKERLEYISTLRQMVLARAKILVDHSNSLFLEYHGGDDVDLNNRLQNTNFIDNLLTVLAHDTAQDSE
jgi:hypothetical protein